MRVCHFAASKGLGRGEVYVDLANHSADTRPDMDVGLLVPRGALFRDRVSKRVQLLEYKAKDSRRNPFLRWEVARLLKQFKPDIVHTHFAKATEVFRKANRRLNLPWVATKHNPRKGRIYEKVSNIIAVAEVVRQSIHEQSATVIYNGIIPDETITRRTDLPADGEPLNLVTAGRLDPIKGYDLLIKVLAEIERPWRLTIYGEGDQRGELESLIASLRLSDRVNLPGFHTDMPQAMAQCDAFVMSSHSEGCSVALLEAMHYAPLVISTPVGLAKELFPDWLLWNLNDSASLGAILGEYGERTRQFNAWVEPRLIDFHLDTTVQKHAALYEQLLAARTKH